MDPIGSDPVDWDVEEVVQFLCDSKSRPWADGSNVPLPRPEDLAVALRENFITGEVLLEEIDKLSLKDDLGVKPLGHRSGIMKAIEWLRSRSTKYQAKNGLSSIHGEVSPRTALSPQIPPSRSSGFIAPIPEQPPPNVPEKAVLPLGTTTPQGKRRIAPQFVHAIEISETSNGNRQPSQGQSPANATLVSTYSPPTNGMTPMRTVSMVENPPGFAVAQETPFNDISELGRSNEALQTRKRANSKSHNSVSAAEDDFFNRLLERYPPGDEHSDGLPIYGDSGSEGQYDDETWEEMQNEAEELQEHSNLIAPIEQSSLSREECVSLITQHIAEKEGLWKEKRLPRELPKAPNIWDYSHSHGSLEQDKGHLAKRIVLYQKRLEKLKGGLLEVEFKDSTTFLQSCASLDPTIADICLDKWTSQILELEECPPRVEPPPRVPRPRKERSDIREDESLGSETDTDLDEDSESNESETESEEDESDFLVIDTEDEPMQDQMDQPHKGLPFTLDSPPPDEQIPSTEPARKKRRIQDLGSDGETASDTESFSEVLRRGNIDTVDLTGTMPTSAKNTGKGPETLPSPARPETMQTGEDTEEMEIETPPLNPTSATVPQDDDITELLMDNPSLTPAVSPVTRVKLTAPRPPESHGKHSRRTSGGNNDSPLDHSDAVSGADEDDVELFNTVEQLSFQVIVASKNRLQLLAKSIPGLRPEEPEQIRKYLNDYFLSHIEDLVHEALGAMRQGHSQLYDEENQGYMRLAALYLSWRHCTPLEGSGLNKQHIKETMKAIEEGETESMFPHFVERLGKLFVAYDRWVRKYPKRSSGLRGTALETSVAGSKPNGKAKSKTKYAPRMPSNIQREAQVRQEKQEALRQEREKRGLCSNDPNNQAVTFKDPMIYLHREIAEHVKPHQLTGIRFMWRELIEAEKPQGCLLAHVMGLGKTMQVISLLVTIAAASASDNPQIREQVPEKFHRSQTLVLCPSAVVQNWLDEFAFWAPDGHHLGPIQGIMSGNFMEVEERFHAIKAWNEKGGVLVISYDLFRILVLNKPTRPMNQNNLSDEQHEMAREALLSGPNIVVADEAHKLKNEKSAISQVTSRFKTMSRIAMTGSPLANNLSEYYQMVEWVAPGYLESATLFKTKFVDPIQSGSYLDSTRSQQRESLCALKILNGILKPKVLRADTSVIAADLPSKTEFVIRIPLTDIQEAAYNIFVSATQAGDDVNARLYSWLAILQLCCNHPQPFWEKLADRTKQPEDSEGSVLPRSMSDSGLPPDLLSQIDELFKTPRRIQDPELSHRAALLSKILDESIKIGDKVLIFTQSLPTMNYIDLMLAERGLKFQRIDGTTLGNERQAVTKRFNSEYGLQILLISTKAGGVGLNMFGANRVVIFDFLFNPTWEEQAVGRAYRLGQTKPVFVYRFVAGGTFEESIFNKAMFKRQLAVRVVDKKNVVRQSRKNSPTLLFPVRPVQKQDHMEFIGTDRVLDQILAGPYGDIILDVSVSHIQNDENDRLTEEESRRVDDELKMERLKRSDPGAHAAEMTRRHEFRVAQDRALHLQRQAAFQAEVTARTEQANQMTQMPVSMATYQCVPRQPIPPAFQIASTGPFGSQYPPGVGQPIPAVMPISTPITPGQWQLNAKYTPSSTSLAPGRPQMANPQGYRPSMISLQQTGQQESRQAPESNRLEISPGTQLNHETRDVDSPVSVIDLSTPNEQIFPTEIILAMGDGAVQPGFNDDVPMDMSEEAEPTPARPSVSGP